MTSAVLGSGSPLRVVHVGLEDVADRPGGLNRYLADLVDAERTLGIDAEAVVLSDDAASADQRPGNRGAGPRSARLATRIWRMAQAATAPPNPDVLDVHFALYALLVVRGRLRRTPLVVHFQGPWAEESSVEGGGRLSVFVKARIERAVYRRADAVVVLSRAFGSLIERRYGVSAFRVHQIAPGVDLEAFRPGDRAVARRALGIDLDARVVLAVRRLRNRMGLDVAIDAVAQLGDAVQLVIVGDGPERARLEASAAASGARVHFAGRVADDELVQWYQAADVSVVPSLELEGFGLVVLESLACGTPVVASDVDGLRDALRGFERARLVPPGDPEALGEALWGALEEATGDASVDVRDACRRYATEFSWHEVARRHRDLYDSVRARRDAEAPTRPRMVILGHSAALSGGELAMARLLPALCAHVDLLVLLADDGPLVDRLRRDGIAVEILAMDRRAREVRKDLVTPGRLPVSAMVESARYTVRLARRLRQLRPDVVHTNSLKAALYGGTAARLARVPTVIWHVRDRIALDYLPRSAAALVRRAAPWLADAVIANSAETLRALSVASLAQTVVPSPLEPTVHRAPFRRDGALRVGVVGRIAPWKGQAEFVRAFADAFGGGEQRGVIVGAALFGEDAYEAEVRALSHELGVDDQIVWRGFQEDIAAELVELDVLVHTSTVPEPFGQVIIEGMAAGLVVIAADAGGPREIIEDGVDGILYPMGDLHALRDALVDIDADPERRRRLSERASVSATRYGAGPLAQRVADFYASVLNA